MLSHLLLRIILRYSLVTEHQTSVASWFFHSLIYSRYTENHRIPESFKPLFHLGCFAPDLVADKSRKKQSHFGLGVGRIPIRYQIAKYKRQFQYQKLKDLAQIWFHRGYLLHLMTDSYWVRRCLHPCLAKFLFSSARWSEAGRIYYGEMVAIDAFFRSAYARYDSESTSIDLLETTEIPGFFPRFLDPNKIRDVIQLLSNTQKNVSGLLKTEYIREDMVHAFLNQTCEISL